ncbi:hypothetical protein [Helicobacter sp. 13S00477-4]|nr:hypothetical protein [Helicobacter sp. 13S00477-4]
MILEIAHYVVFFIVLVSALSIPFVAIKTALDMDKDDDKNKKIVKK